MYSLLFAPTASYSFNIRNYTNLNGLSNSAVQTIYQTADGLLWVGTCDGLNVFDGTRFRIYPFFDDVEHLSGNLINKVLDAGDNNLWVQTNYGLDFISKDDMHCKSFENFLDTSIITITPEGNFFILDSGGNLYYIRKGAKSMNQVNFRRTDFLDIAAMKVTADHHLLIVKKNGFCEKYAVNESGDMATITVMQGYRVSNSPIQYAVFEHELLLVIDEKGVISEYNFKKAASRIICNISSVLAAKGVVSCMLRKENEYLIGLESSGLVLVDVNSPDNIKVTDTGIHAGVFCLWQDRFQDIVWVGTDGSGVYMLYDDEQPLSSFSFDDIKQLTDNPVRALYLDKKGTLWIGTKGSGILCIDKFDSGKSLTEQMGNFRHITSAGNGLANNTVYCFKPDSNGGLWIGTELGLSYFDNASGRMQSFYNTSDGHPIRYVHSIECLNDTALWLATVGDGGLRIGMKFENRTPKLTSYKQLLTGSGLKAQNYFFTSLMLDQNHVLMGNRGFGLFNVDVESCQYRQQLFDSHAKSRLANDIFCIHKDSNGYWLGTSFGLVHVDNYGTQPTFHDVIGGTVKTVHTIEGDSSGNLWFATNNGIVKYNPNDGFYMRFNQNNELSVIEFSDGASFLDESSGQIFFGGVNGFVTVNSRPNSLRDFMPPITFVAVGVGDKTTAYQPGKTIAIDHSHNTLRLEYNAINFISPNTTNFLYRLDDSKEWISNGTQYTLILSSLSSGKHTLHMKYKSDMLNRESPEQHLELYVMPPWYLTIWAYIIYLMIVVAIVAVIFNLTRRHYHRKQKAIIHDIQEQKKEDIYEAKLRFFTNITHEFCSPLTLIYGPCEKIMGYVKSDDYIKKYTSLIRQNTEKLRELILELLEFRRIETDHKELKIQQVPVSECLKDVILPFDILVENREIHFTAHIQPDMQWNTDLSCFKTITTNLLSNAFKYTPNGGNIDVSLAMSGENLVFSISNDGKGIKPQDLGNIFDRYRILEGFEANKKDSRTGLGLAICKSMVDLLGGTIKVQSERGGITTFTVTLRPLAVQEELADEAIKEQAQEINTIGIELSLNEKTPIQNGKINPSMPTVMVVDDERAILDFIAEIFVEHYNVLRYDNAASALEAMQSIIPNIIISDANMPEMDGYTFIQKVKADKLLNHIPVILISAYQYEDDKIRGIDSGADAYVTKPFSIKYLESLVERMLRRNNELENYYSSALQSVVTGIDSKLMHKEDHELLQRIFEIIERNVQ
ncbi:MAG: response regulator, partial [Bacteroidaceae bacterium]|nr:response regulator [Bacteroidaceae bacterium]